MRVIKFVGIAVFIYLVVVLFYTLMQRSFIYYPQTQSLESALASVERSGGSTTCLYFHPYAATMRNNHPRSWRFQFMYVATPNSDTGGSGNNLLKYSA